MKHKGYETEKKEFQEELVKIIDEHLGKEIERSTAKDTELANQLAVMQEETSGLKIGLLSIQGKQYRDECEMLLDANHIITIDEFEQEEEDYHAYKSLKGNHRGDALHNAVVAKFNGSVS